MAVRVRARQKFSTYLNDTCQLVEAEAGTEFAGHIAVHMLATLCPVDTLEIDDDGAPGDDTPTPADPPAGPPSDPSDPPADPTPADGPPAQGDDEPFDPAQHTVAEVLAYAAEHPDVAEQIHALEAATRARTGVLSALA